MKKFLLSFCFFSTVLATKAQQTLPLMENFENGAPSGWMGQGNATSIEPYTANAGSGCNISSRGYFVPYGPGLNDGNNARAISPVLGFINQNSLVTVQFDLFAYSSRAVKTCVNQITTACSPTVRLYLVNENYNLTAVPPANMVYAQSATIALNTNNTNNGVGPSVSALVSNAIPANTKFKVFLLFNFGNCPGATGYILDNLLISEREEAPLPVTFKTFSAERKDVNVSLKWTTASEQNNKGFNIQRKTGGEWQTIAFVASQSNGGNSSTELNYEFQDANPEKGISQYRVQQVDFDGKSLFSIIRAVRGQEQFSKIVVYPNPSNGAFSVMFNDLQAKDVQLSDAYGRVLSRYTNVINNIEVKNLKSGLYNVHITDRASGVKIVLKAVVQ